MKVYYHEYTGSPFTSLPNTYQINRLISIRQKTKNYVENGYRKSVTSPCRFSMPQNVSTVMM